MHSALSPSRAPGSARGYPYPVEMCTNLPTVQKISRIADKIIFLLTPRNAATNFLMMLWNVSPGLPKFSRSSCA